MRLILILLLLTTSTLNAQELLFEKRFVQSEDQWVIFPQDDDGSYVFGFIYIDAQAGLTLNYEGKFTIGSDGIWKPERMKDVGSMKYRLEPNNVKVAIVPPSKYKDLGITATPEWLHYYKTDTASVKRLHRWGYYYNHWGESEKALTYLERAIKMAPDDDGIIFELAFAYNATGQYAKAEEIAERGVKLAPGSCYLYKELSFAQMHLEKLNAAAGTCRKGIVVCENKVMRAEIAYNLAYRYYMHKDKDNFKLWATETEKWATPGDRYMKNIDIMRKEVND